MLANSYSLQVNKEQVFDTRTERTGVYLFNSNVKSTKYSSGSTTVPFHPRHRRLKPQDNLQIITWKKVCATLVHIYHYRRTQALCPWFTNQQMYSRLQQGFQEKEDNVLSNLSTHKILIGNGEPHCIPSIAPIFVYLTLNTESSSVVHNSFAHPGYGQFGTFRFVTEHDKCWWMRRGFTDSIQTWQ